MHACQKSEITQPQQSPPQPQNPPNPLLTFLHPDSPNSPQSLIMLVTNPNISLNKIYKSIPNLWLWVEKDPPDGLISQIQRMFQIKILWCRGLGDAVGIIQKKKKEEEGMGMMGMIGMMGMMGDCWGGYGGEEEIGEIGDEEEDQPKAVYFLIAPQAGLEKVWGLLDREEIEGGIFYTLGEQNSDDSQEEEEINEAVAQSTLPGTTRQQQQQQQPQQQSNLQPQPQLLPQLQLLPRFLPFPTHPKKPTRFPSTLSQLHTSLSHWNKQSLKSLQLQNFIPFSSATDNCNILVATYQAMLDQKIDPQTRRKLVKALRDFMRKVMPEEEMGMVEEFFEELAGKERIEDRIALEYYTKQSGIYKFLNHMLRAVRHPAQLYYIQPYFKDLFLSIQNLFKSDPNLNLKTPKKLDLIRGGYVSKSELKLLKNNIGRLVQNLGFLSTSENFYIAEKFIQNAVFYICVDYGDGCGGNCYGFADISEFSEYYAEGEYLFNPLNFFKVLKIITPPASPTTPKKIHQIYLSFQFLPKIFTTPYSSLSPLDKSLSNFKIFQINEFNNVCQGHALVRNGDNLPYALDYWRYYYRVARKFRDRLYGLHYWIDAEGNSGNQGVGLGLGLYKLGLIWGWWRKKYMGMLSEEQEHEEKDEKVEEEEEEEEVGGQQDVDKFLEGLSRLSIDQIWQRIMKIVNQINPDKLFPNLNHYHQTLKQISILSTTINTNLQSCLTLLQICTKIHKKLHSTPTIHYADTLDALGKVHTKLHNFEMALKFYEESRGIRVEILGEEHPAYGNCLGNIAEVLVAMGEKQKENWREKERENEENEREGKERREKTKMEYYEQARIMMKRCLEIRARVLGKLHPQYVVGLNLYARIYERKGQYNKALFIQKQCCQLGQKVYGVNHPNYPRILTTLANIYTSLKDHQSALALHLKCLELPHREHLAILQNLALTYLNLYKYQQSLQKYEQLLSIYKNILASNSNLHSNHNHNHNHNDKTNVLTYTSLLVRTGQVHLRINEDKRALQLFEEARYKIKQVLGDNSRECSEILHYMGRVYHKAGNYGKARGIYETAGKMLVDVGVACNDRSYIGIMLDIGRTYQDQSNHPKALHYYQKSHQKLLTSPSTPPSQLLPVLKYTANLLTLKKQPKQALQLYEQCLQIVTKESKGCSQVEAEFLTCKANLMVGLGWVKEGLGMYERCERIWVWIGARGSPGYVYTLSCIANTHMIIGDYAQALNYSNKSLKTLQKFSPIPPSLHLKCLSQKAKILTILHSHQSSYKIYKKICAMLQKCESINYSQYKFYLNQKRKAQLAWRKLGDGDGKVGKVGEEIWRG